MNTIKYLLLSIVIAMSLPAWGCLSEPVTHYYIFYAGEGENDYNLQLMPRQASVWSQLLGRSVTAEDLCDISWANADELNTSNSPFIKAIVTKRDDGLYNYLRNLVLFSKAARLDYNQWDYPSKQEIAHKENVLRGLAMVAGANSDNRLARQYKLMVLRCAFYLKNWAEVERLWKKFGRERDVFTDMADDYYAGMLFRTGRMEEAAEIYGRLGDVESASRCVSKWGDVEGLRRMYKINPNSAVLPMLIKQYCDDLQESLDALRDDNTGFYGEEDVDPDTVRKIARRKADDFVQLANEVILGGKSRDAMMWANAAALLKYYNGDIRGASEMLSATDELSSTDVSRLGRRYISIFVKTAAMKNLRDNEDWLAGELAWLLDTRKTNGDGRYPQNHAGRMLVRLSMEELLPRFNEEENMNGMLVAVALNKPVMEDYPEEGWTSWNPNYSSDYFQMLDSIPIADVRAWNEWLSTGSGAWHRVAQRVAGADNVMLKELIGTRYLRQGEFSKACEWLKDIPSDYISHMNVSCYMSSRDFRNEPWIKGRQKTLNEYELVRVKGNPKLEYCQYVMGLMAAAAKAQGASAKYDADMALAAAYYQASVYGPCWWLTQYHWSQDNGGFLYAGDKDFCSGAISLLRNCMKNAQGRQKYLAAVYALTYITPGDYREYDWQTDDYRLLPTSPKYKALQLLNEALNGTTTRSWDLPRCDVLVSFRKSTR